MFRVNRFGIAIVAIGDIFLAFSRTSPPSAQAGQHRSKYQGYAYHTGVIVHHHQRNE